jgi:catechol 2,3-dioxygenase-like lactoylglutathione lyase family enzyme
MNRYGTNGRGGITIGSMRVESVSVPVSDQERAKSFYVDTLGFELLVDSTWREGMRWSEVAPERSTTSLMLVSWQAGMLPGMYRVIVMATDDIRAIHEELLARGIDFELPPTQTPRGTQAMFRDPFGNPLMFWEHTEARIGDVSTAGAAFGLVEGRGGARSS